MSDRRKIWVRMLCLWVFWSASGLATVNAFPLFEEWSASDELAENPSWYRWVAQQVAWEYKPNEAYELMRIELFSGAGISPNGDGTMKEMTVGIAADEAGRPGPLLISANYLHHSAYSWQGATFSHPISIQPNTTYWVYWENPEGLYGPQVDSREWRRYLATSTSSTKGSWLGGGGNGTGAKIRFFAVPEPSGIELHFVLVLTALGLTRHSSRLGG